MGYTIAPLSLTSHGTRRQLMASAGSVRLMLMVSCAMLTLSRPAHSQQPPDPIPIRPALPRNGSGNCTCSGMLQFVSLGVRRKDGTAIPDASLIVRPEGVDSVLRRDEPPITTGTYVIVQDGDLMLRDAPAGGIALVVEVRWKQHRTQVRIVVGANDPCGCHVRKRAGPMEVVFP